MGEPVWRMSRAYFDAEFGWGGEHTAEIAPLRDWTPQDVGSLTQDVGELGLLEPMPLRLTVNGAMAMRGTLQQVRAAVAHLMTEWLAVDPEGLALDAQTLNLAFNTGAVADSLAERGEWTTTVGLASEHQIMQIRISREG